LRLAAVNKSVVYPNVLALNHDKNPKAMPLDLGTVKLKTWLYLISEPIVRDNTENKGNQ